MPRRMHELKTPEQSRLLMAINEAKALRIYPDINWDDCRWDITKFGKPLAHEKRSLNLYFTPHSRVGPQPTDRKNISYEQPFADFAKSIITTRASERGLSFKGHTHMMIALRYLYDALLHAGSADPTHLNRKIFAIAMTSVQAKASGWTIYHVGKTLQEVSRWMDERQLTRAEIDFVNNIPCPSKGDGLDPESQARGLLKMPSATALDALADISNNPGNDNERIIVRIIDLLVIGGFRIGEVLSIPLDCWVEAPALTDLGKFKTNPVNGERIVRYGIRYWPEKAGPPYIKWLPDIAVPLAKRAVTDLRTLCAEARAAADSLELNPDRVPLPGCPLPDDLLDHKELMVILGFKAVQSVNQMLRSIGVKPVGRRRKSTRDAFLYRVRDIEEGLLQRRAEMVIVKRPDGKLQMLSQSLCVMFRNQFRSRLATIRFLPELIGVAQVRDALGGGNSTSIFSVRGLTEPGGSQLKIRTHAFRHWLNTLLDRGGLSDLELARWSGRRNIDHNAAYKHGTVEQRVSWARDMIKEGSLRGPAADTYHSINDPIEKDEFLQTFVNVALFTPYGVCIHDYAIDPCPYHLNCLGGCSEYLRTKGDKNEQKKIMEVRDFHLVQLQRVKIETVKDTGTIQNYRAHCERIVEGARAALTVDMENVPDGKLVKVFPNRKRTGKPITAL